MSQAQAPLLGTMYTAPSQISTDHPPCVYVLVDPRWPSAPRYVGSSRALRERLRGHQKHGATRNPEFAAWVQQLAAEGVRPALRVVVTFDSEASARRAEWRIQRRWERLGLPLVSKVTAPVEDYHLTWAGARARLARHWPEAPWAA